MVYRPVGKHFDMFTFEVNRFTNQGVNIFDKRCVLVMGQSTILLAFRKRLKKRGYTNIHIKNTYRYDEKGHKDYSYYFVSAVEPLSKKVVDVTDKLENFSFYMR